MSGESRAQVTSLLDATRDFDTDPLFSRLRAVTNDLIVAYRELALIEQAERKQKIEVYFAVDEPTISGRDRYAEGAVIDHTLDRIGIRADIAAYEAERDLLVLMIEHGVPSDDASGTS